ncbi:MAG: Dam family site-specific DNA-(adenine-N6)-methyltransferase [Thermoplasmata archaeon]|nr:Dam family site-specific DNA-(adenine-N6)-methyltransferase [Thermoplasmata archaeon]
MIARLGPAEAASTYFEPFLGGGAVFFRLQPKHAVLSDLNRSLTDTYAAVKTNVEDLITELEKLCPPSTRKAYEAIREEFNELRRIGRGGTRSDSIRRSSLFIWLNHCCFNGLYRENKDGDFNVPFGYYKDAFIYDPSNLREASRALEAAHADLKCADYATVLSSVRPGDQVYLDPPYDPVGGTANFTGYTSSGFGAENQWQLSNLVHQLIQRSCRVVMSNSPTPDIRELYSDMSHEMVLVPRAINCNGSKRGRVGEMLLFPRQRLTLHDRLDRVIRHKGFKLDGIQTYQFTSAELKAIGGAEPRLIAKMDTREQLPPMLADRGYFLIPTSTRNYAIVPGEGYHDLEGIDEPPKSYTPDREIPVTVALKSGESAAIQTALYSGLLEKVVGVPQLKSTLHNDKVTIHDSEIHYGKDWSLRLKGAQAEVDAGFENHGDFFLFECKVWSHATLRDFNVRQLFFPQLQALEEFEIRGLKLRPRCFFLNVEPDSATYRFWEYTFGDPHDYSDIRLVQKSAYRLAQDKPSSPTDLLEELLQQEISQTTYVPQADDPSKLVALLDGVGEGLTTADQLADRFQFDPRQSNYYGEAAEELGMLTRERGRGFSLTALGAKIAKDRSDVAARAVIERILTLPVFRGIAESAIKAHNPTIDLELIPQMIVRTAKDRYNETTIRRRTQSVAAWLNWIGEVTGTIRVRPSPPPLRGQRPLEQFV